MSSGTIFESVGLVEHERGEQRLVRLLSARLSLTVLSFGIAIGLDGLGRDLSEAARQGLYATVAVAFAATVLSGIMISRVRRVAAYALLQIMIDVGIVTSLVYHSGGRESVFTFLYVVVTLYGALLFDRRGALTAATFSAIAYAGILFGAHAGTGSGAVETRLPILVTTAIWGVHVGALYLVGVLASLLSSELQRTGRALDERTSDLKTLRDLYQRTVESIMSGLLTTDIKGRVTSFNPEAERITRLSADEAMGRTVEAIIPGTSALVLREGDAPGGVALSRARLEYRNADGQALFLGLAASILRGEDGAAVGHVVIFQDVTDVVAMEQELRSSERLAAVGEMAAKIAHEIRNPLASMSGSVQILRSTLRDEDQDAESAQLMDIVVRETDRLNGLITDFLRYSRPTPLAPRSIEVRGLLEEVATLLEVGKPENVGISVVGEVGLCVTADVDQLKQILWNLSINGIEAMPDGGELTIGVDRVQRDPSQEGAGTGRRGVDSVGMRRASSEPRESIEIAISDVGDGIPPDVLERIFEPFFTTKRQGTGLGLAMVHRSVESHGGSLLVASREGEGTTFRVRLAGSELTE